MSEYDSDDATLAAIRLADYLVRTLLPNVPAHNVNLEFAKARISELEAAAQTAFAEANGLKERLHEQAKALSKIRVSCRAALEIKTARQGITALGGIDAIALRGLGKTTAGETECH